MPEILQGLLQWDVMLLISCGVLVGLVVGVIPGMSGTLGIALLLPFTLYLNPVQSVALLIGVYKASLFGGSITAITVGTPGTPSAALDVLDGYPLAKQGKAKKAIDIALYASVIADFGSDLVLLFVIGPIAAIALAFGSREMLALVLFSMVIIVMFIQQSPLRGVVSLCIGVLLGLVGRDDVYAAPRFAFGSINLLDGIELVPLVIGLLAFSEILVHFKNTFNSKRFNMSRNTSNKSFSYKEGGENLTLKELLLCSKEIFIGFSVGTFIGALPGLGSAIAAYVAYAIAKKVSRKGYEFGKGSLEGLAAAEAANSASCGPAFIPMFTMGIPGSTMAALFMSAFMMQGYTVGPGLIREDPSIFYLFIFVIIFANFFNFGWSKLLAPVFARVSYLPGSVLTVFLSVLCIIGVYSYRLSSFDVFVMICAGIMGYWMRANKLSLPATVIAFILTPLIEVNLGRVLILGKGNVLYFFQSTIASTILLLTIVLIIVLTVWKEKKVKSA